MTQTSRPLTSRPSALGKRLVPTVGIDTGSAATAITLRVGAIPVAASVVLNPEFGVRGMRHAPGADPAHGYPAACEAEVTRLRDEYADVARAWWGDAVPGDADPWLYAIEKINPARQPRTDTERARFDAPAFAEQSTFAAVAVLNRLLGAFHSQIVWTRPAHADTRWQANFEDGTGDPRDFYPNSLLGDVIAADDERTVFPDYLFDEPRHRESRIKDVLAAWSISCDAAEDYERACRRLFDGRVLPPHAAPSAVRRASPAALNPAGPVQVRRFDVPVTDDVAAVRADAAQRRLDALAAGIRTDAEAVARDLLAVAEHRGVPVEDLVTQWQRNITADPFASPLDVAPQHAWLAEVRRNALGQAA